MCYLMRPWGKDHSCRYFKNCMWKKKMIVFPPWSPSRTEGHCRFTATFPCYYFLGPYWSRLIRPIFTFILLLGEKDTIGQNWIVPSIGFLLLNYLNIPVADPGSCKVSWRIPEDSQNGNVLADKVCSAPTHWI